MPFKSAERMSLNELPPRFESALLAFPCSRLPQEMPRLRIELTDVEGLKPFWVTLNPFNLWMWEELLSSPLSLRFGRMIYTWFTPPFIISFQQHRIAVMFVSRTNRQRPSCHLWGVSRWDVPIWMNLAHSAFRSTDMNAYMLLYDHIWSYMPIPDCIEYKGTSGGLPFVASYLG